MKRKHIGWYNSDSGWFCYIQDKSNDHIKYEDYTVKVYADWTKSSDPVEVPESPVEA